jgi:hypothetical protein
LDSGNNNRLLRSTSSIRYKFDIEPLDASFSDNVLKLTPVWYRSKAKADPSDWSYYGLIAEDVAEVDPRLVFWGYQEDQFEHVETDGVSERRLKDGEQKRPDGVQYERLSVLLIDVVKRQQAQIDNILLRIEDLERRLNAKK